MENFLNINLSSTLDKDTIFNLFTSKNSNINIDLLAKILKFNSNIDFFNFYSGVDLNLLLNDINKIKLGLTSIILNRSEEKNNSYFSSLSKIIASLQLIYKINKITNESLIQIEKYSNIFFNKNEVNQKLKSEIKECIHDLLSKNDFHQNEKLIDNNNDNIGYNDINFTPKFECFEPAKRFPSSITVLQKNESQKKFNKNIGENCYKSCRSLIVSSKKKYKKKSPHIKKREYESVKLDVLINDMNDLNFSFGEISQKNDKKNLSKFVKKNRSQIFNKAIKISPTKRICCEENKSSKKIYTDMYFNLLQIIKESYQKGLINAEEKLLIKKIIISKPELIFDIYQKYYLNILIKDKNNKQYLLNEIKKFLLQNNL